MLHSGILRMTRWIDPVSPDHVVVPDVIVTTAARNGPHRPTGRAIQRDRLPIEVDMPPARMKGQHCEFTATHRDSAG